MVELADAPDSKSGGSDTMWVQVPPSAPDEEYEPSFFRIVRIFYIRLIFFSGDKIHGLATNMDNGTKLAYEYRH